MSPEKPKYDNQENIENELIYKIPEHLGRAALGGSQSSSESIEDIIDDVPGIERTESLDEDPRDFSNDRRVRIEGDQLHSLNPADAYRRAGYTESGGVMYPGPDNSVETQGYETEDNSSPEGYGDEKLDNVKRQQAIVEARVNSNLGNGMPRPRIFRPNTDRQD